MLADNRLHPRVATNLEVKAGIPGESSQARVVDISLGGVTIKGDGELARVLVLNQDNPQGESADHVVCFDLPTQEFSNVCRLVNIQRLSQVELEFGLKFLELDMRDVASISVYINNHVR